MELKPILELKGICKYFPGVKALDNANLQFVKGEVHALLGQNGAGKSTLIKILTGAYEKTAGEIYYNGVKLEELSPKAARDIGISAIYQELTLFPELSVAKNIFMGNEIFSKLFDYVDDSLMNKNTVQIFKRLKLNILPETLVKNLSIAERQMVEIARAISYNAKILIMDEPTSSLSKKETEILFNLIKELKTQGVTIVYISHRMEEIFSICDRVTVMRDGKVIQTLEVNKIKDTTSLVDLMVNRKLGDFYPKNHIKLGKKVLEVKNLTQNGVFYDISFAVRKGEIFGIGGLVGSKRTEIGEALFGLRKWTSGQVLIDGKDYIPKSPEDAIKHGLGFITEDRKNTGIIKTMSVKENITLPNLKKFKYGIGLIINLNKERIAVANQLREFNIKTPTMDQQINKLSGGNQQKSIISRWISINANVLIMDEPTRGIDVGSKAEIYGWMGRLVEQGASIIMISSENQELLEMSDKIMVIKEGRVSGFLEGSEKTETNILKLMFGGGDNGR